MARASKLWEKIGMLLNYSLSQLDEIKHARNGRDELCWCHLMEEWLLARGIPPYSATWDGLHSMLVDAEAYDLAQLLRRAVTHAIPPPPPPASTTTTGHSTKKLG